MIERLTTTFNFLFAAPLPCSFFSFAGTNIDNEQAKKVLNIIDTDNDGNVDVLEFLRVSQGPELMKAIEQHERTKKRHLIKPKKRALIESRRPLAKGTTHMHTGIHFDETSHDKHLKRCYQKNGIGSHRDAFYRPEHILDKLRKRIKTSAIIGMCFNIKIFVLTTTRLD